MTLLIAYVLLALVVSFSCSLLEAVLLSVTPGYIAVLEQEGSKTAGKLRALKQDIDRPLAAILSLNTIAHTVGAAGAGAQAARVFGSAAVGIFSAVLTLLILVLTEIIPKTLGAVHWKRLAPLVVRVLRILMILMWPLVILAQWLTRLLTRGRDDTTVSKQEIAALAEAGKKEGVVQEGESRMLHNLFRLAVLTAEDVMTPADHIEALAADTRIGDAICHQLKFSRIPLYSGDERDRYDGYVLKDDLLTRAAHDDHPVRLRDLRRELLKVPADMPLPELFDRMVARREHIALVEGQRAAAVGVVTMEDIIETLLGLEIFDEVDQQARLRQAARQHWLERARRLGRVSDAVGGEATLGITGGEPSGSQAA